jgi:hypothetical protein
MHDSLKSLLGPIKETVEVKSFRDHGSKKSEFSGLSNGSKGTFTPSVGNILRTNCR